nr:hypothetical protein [Tanacetum cinerariifolium]
IEAGVPFFMFPRFVQLLIDNQLGDMSHHKDIYDNPSLTKKVFANMKRVGTGFSRQTQAPKVPSPKPSPEHRLPSPSNDPLLGGKDSLKLKKLIDLSTHLSNKVLELESEVIDIKSTYKERIEKLEGRVDMLKEENMVLKELHSVYSKVDTAAPVVEKENSFKQGGIIANIDEDVEINLETAQAKPYRMDLEHPKKVLSMQDVDDEEPAKVEEVLEVVTAAKLITEVVTTTEATTTAEATKVSVPRRKRGVVIQDPKETTSTVVVHSEVQSKDKGKGILTKEPKSLKGQAQIEQDEAFARQLEAKLNTDINWNAVIEQVKRSERLNDANMAGYKMNYFKGMTYSVIRPLFEKHYNYNQAFIEEVNEEVTVPENKVEVEGHKREGESLENEITKKQKMDEEADVEASVWRDQKGGYGLAKRYHLTHFILEQMLNNVRLEVKEEREMSLELLRLVRRQLNERNNRLQCITSALHISCCCLELLLAKKDLFQGTHNLEDEVVSLLEKEKANLEIIKSLKLKGFESSENIISESENQSENDCHAVEKGCDNLENSNVITQGMFKINVSQSVSPISAYKMSCASKNVENKINKNRHEASEVIISFIKKMQVNLQLQVQRVRADNGTEFKNKNLAKLFDEVRISQQFFAARTPQQNSVVERRNRTLVEAARTMLTFANLPLFLRNSLLYTKLFDYSQTCYLLNDYDDVGMLKAKGDIGMFIGYSKESTAFRVYNKRTRKIHENVNLNFDEISKMASKQFSLEPGLSNLNETGKSSNPTVSQVSEISKKHLEDLFYNFYDEYFDSSKITKSPTTNVETSNNEIPSHEGEVFHEVSELFQKESSSSSLNDNVQQSLEEVMVPPTNTQSISNNMVPNVNEASSSHNVFNERLKDAYFDASTTPMILSMFIHSINLTHMRKNGQRIIHFIK